LLGDLLDVAALDAGRLRIRPTPTDVAAVVAEEVELLRPVAESRSLSMTFEARAAALTSAIDRKRISRVLLNVITNAIKYTPPDGSIAVLVERDGNDALISVSDTGPGIAAEQLELIFERFHRADPNERGYGLGLYIARAIVDAHGGRIWAESKLGEGSTFRIRLPGTVRR
jgi:signal transduction histidine kinase